MTMVYNANIENILKLRQCNAGYYRGNSAKLISPFSDLAKFVISLILVKQFLIYSQ